jgi:hypothetical protein
MISTYSELLTAVRNWMDDADLAEGRIQEFLALFESKTNRRLRNREMICKTSTLTVAGQEEYSPLPADFAGMKHIQANDRDLDLLTPEQLRIAAGRDNTDTGQAGYCILGDVLHIAPAPASSDLAITMWYYQRVPPLGDGTGGTYTSNWLLTKYPDAYLSGVLLEADIYVYDEKRWSLHNRRLEVAMDEIFLENWNNVISGSTMNMKVM